MTEDKSGSNKGYSSRKLAELGDADENDHGGSLRPSRKASSSHSSNTVTRGESFRGFGISGLTRQ